MPDRPPSEPPASTPRITWTDLPSEQEEQRIEIALPQPAIPRRAGARRSPRGTRRDSSPPESSEQKTPQESRVEWDAGQPSGLPDLAKLVGIEDAFEHTPLEPGEQVAYCKYDQVAYHLSTWEFLRKENGGRCCSCGRAGTIALFQLPGGPLERPFAVPAPAILPTWMGAGEALIGLEEVYQHVGHAIVIEAQVYEVYKTLNTGTYFVRFEERQTGDTPFAGFKIVIFPGYEREWSKLGLTPRMYAGHRIRARGLIQVHPMWGIEILVNSPRVIQIIEDTDSPPSE